MTQIDMFLGGARALGKRGFEALDRNERSVGIFPTQRG
jgi:hypothetical protein